MKTGQNTDMISQSTATTEAELEVGSRSCEHLKYHHHLFANDL